MTAHDWGDLAADAAADAILDEALAAADGHCQFADVRLIEAEELRLYTQLGADPDERLEHNLGVGVRVLVDGIWGFAAGTRPPCRSIRSPSTPRSASNCWRRSWPTPDGRSRSCRRRPALTASGSTDTWPTPRVPANTNTSSRPGPG